MNDLYRTIDERGEFRGDEYFDATVKLRWWMPKPLELKTHPYRWSGLFREGDELIIRKLKRNEYVVCASKREDGTYGVPIPSYADAPLEYRIHQRYLANITRRPQMAVFDGLDKFINPSRGENA